MKQSHPIRLARLPLATLLFALTLPALAATTQTRSFEYDALGRLAKEIDANGKATQYTYDANGNRLSRTDALGNKTRYSYDALNRLTSLTDPAGGITTFSYDAHDNLVTVKDPRGLSTSYSYNGLGDLLQQISPDSGTTTYGYDTAGNQTSRTDARSKTATRTFDALGRITRIAYGDQTHNFTWDSGSNGIGRLGGFTDPSGSTSFSYDTLGRVTGKSQTFTSIGGVAGTRSVAYQYDSAGRLTQITYPSGNRIGYSYDTHGRIASVSLNGAGFISQITYQPFGGLKGWSWANGTIHQRSYDLNGRLTYLQHGSDYSKSYSWDDANRITRQTDAQYATRTQVYGYDTLDRLTSTTRNTTSEAYQYDANGNRSKLTVGSASTQYALASDSNRVTALSGASSKAYTYDAAGNLTGDGVFTYVYNNAGRLVNLRNSGGSVASYIYNATHQLAIKTNWSKPIQFVYDEAGRLLGEYSDPGAQSVTQETVWLGDTPIATLQPVNGSLASPKLYYIYADHLNAPRRIVDPVAKQTVWYWDGEAFGNTYPDEDPDKNGVKLTYNLRYPGQYYDRNTKAFYNWHRYYDPSAGRYLQSDPIGLDGGINTYSYVASQPTRYFDRNGLEIEGNWITPRLMGICIHQGFFGQIQRSPALRNSGWVTDRNHGVGDGRPDASTQDYKLVGELKPDTWSSGQKYSDAKAQMKGYCNNLWKPVNSQNFLKDMCGSPNQCSFPVTCYNVPFWVNVRPDANPTTGLMFYDFSRMNTSSNLQGQSNSESSTAPAGPPIWMRFLIP